MFFQKCYFMFTFICLFSPVQCNVVYNVWFNMSNGTKYEKTKSNIIILTKNIWQCSFYLLNCEANHFLICKAGRVHSFRCLSVAALPLMPTGCFFDHLSEVSKYQGKQPRGILVGSQCKLKSILASCLLVTLQARHSKHSHAGKDSQLNCVSDLFTVKLR